MRIQPSDSPSISLKNGEHYKGHPVWTGVLWAVGIALIIGIVTVIVYSLDVLLSSVETQHSFLSGAAEALYRYGLFSSFFQQDWSYLSEYSEFGLQWLAVTMGFYFLRGRRFDEAAARRKCILGFVIAFPIVSLAVGVAAVLVVFRVGVAKFGF